MSENAVGKQQRVLKNNLFFVGRCESSLRSNLEPQFSKFDICTKVHSLIVIFIFTCQIIGPSS